MNRKIHRHDLHNAYLAGMNAAYRDKWIEEARQERNPAVKRAMIRNARCANHSLLRYLRTL